MQPLFSKRGKPGHKGFTRIILAGRYSLSGFRSAWIKEAAFRQEAILIAPALLLVTQLDVTPVEKSLLWASALLVLIIELLNSSIEATVDRISQEHHPLSGCAKDMGSAAVTLSLILMLGVWLCIII